MPIKRIKDFADGGSDISSDDVFLLWMILLEQEQPKKSL